MQETTVEILDTIAEENPETLEMILQQIETTNEHLTNQQEVLTYILGALVIVVLYIGFKFLGKFFGMFFN